MTANRSRTQSRYALARRALAGGRLTVLYVAALSTVALLSLVAQALVQRQLRDGENDSRVINIAGRQRMLSQRLAKASLRMAINPADLASDSEELRETLELWSRSHRGLQEGDADQRLPGGNSPEVKRLFASTDEYYQAMRRSSKTLLDDSASVDEQDKAVAIIQANERAFLEGMDRIVSQYVLEAEAKVSRLKSLELGILVLTLVVLTAEGLFVFRPAVRQINRTLTRLNRTGKRLRIAKQSAEEADNAKSRFLANVSHELRTPMTAVLGMTELALDEKNEQRRRRHLATVSRAGKVLLGLLNDLIDFARIESGKLELDIRPFSPHEVLNHVVEMMRPACCAKGLRLVVLTEVDSELRVLGDARRLEQVLMNLLSNAIKWTTEGLIYARCEVIRSHASLVTLRYMIQDTGVGIREEDHSVVFEPFAQIAGDKTSANTGVGLGLAICRRIADAMGADLRLSSRHGEGTSVSLTGDYCVAAPPCAVADKSEQAPAIAPLRALVVEDTQVVQQLLRELLEREGMSFAIVGSGEEALELAQTQQFEIALIDLQLPGIDGVTTVQKLRDLDQDCAFVCVTSAARAPSDNPQLLEAFDSVLLKPFSAVELRSELRKVTNKTHRADADNADSPPTDQGVFDPMRIDRDLAVELANAYLAAAEEQEQELRETLASEDWRSVQFLAHRFAGQAGNFDSPKLVKLLQQLEDACAAQHAQLAREYGAKCLPELAALRDRLGELVEADPVIAG